MMLHSRTRPVLFTIGLLFLSGCAASGHIEQLKQFTPQANDYPSALATEYLSYSESELEMGHPIHADYFARKGLEASEGKAVAPEDVPGGLPEVVSEQLKSSRHYLLKLLTDDMKRVSPQEAARAQLLFDCWAHQQSKHPADEGVPCAQEFESAIAALETVAESFAYTQEMEELLIFVGKTVALSDEQLQKLDDIAYEVSALLNYHVEIYSAPHGRSGSYHKIAALRAEEVKQALVDRGVPPSYIQIHDNTTAKTVYLSNDEEDQPRNSVRILVKATPEEKVVAQ